MDPMNTAIQVSLVGLLVVFSALVLIGLLISLLGRLDKPTPPKAAETDTPVPDEIIAVISAAVTASLGRGARIHRVRYERPRPDHSWSEQGRIIITASHVTRP